MKQYITVYDSGYVKTAIIKLASKVYNIIEEKGAENCMILTVLEGGAYLSHKIIDRLGRDMLSFLETASIKVSSYHGDQHGELTYDYLPNIDCKGKTVIIIDDFCDSGSTTNNLNKLYKERFEAEDVIFVTLLARKKRKLDEDVKLIYGIEDSTSNFYIGCGLDDDGKSRYIDCIMTVFDVDEKEK